TDHGRPREVHSWNHTREVHRQDEEEHRDEHRGEPSAVQQSERVREDRVVHELDDQLYDTLQPSRVQFRARGVDAREQQTVYEHDQPHQLYAIELEPRSFEQDRRWKDLVQRRDVEELVLGKQCWTDVCGVQLDLPWSYGRTLSRRPWPSQRFSPSGP